MASMFSAGYGTPVAMAFSQDVGNWNTSRVNDISFMFYGCRSFAADLSRWDLSSIARVSKLRHALDRADSSVFPLEHRPAIPWQWPEE